MTAFYLFAFSGVALALGLELRAHRRRRLAVFLVQAAAVLALLWIVSFALIEVDETGAGGAFDCWPGCSLYQEGVHAGFVLPPALLLLLIVAALLLTLVGRSGASASPAPGSDRTPD